MKRATTKGEQRLQALAARPKSAGLGADLGFSRELAEAGTPAHDLVRLLRDNFDNETIEALIAAAKPRARKHH